MASFLCQVQTIQRSAGRSAVAAAAYRSGESLADERLAMEFDFSRKDGVEFTEILAPQNAAAPLSDRETLWNAAEAAERRRDAVPAREILLALPHELDLEQRRALVRAFVAEHVTGRGMIADVAMHRPGAVGDQRNFHAHVLVTTRRVEGEGFGAKEPAWWSPQQVRDWRAGWAEIQNEHLRRHLGPKAPQVSDRSLAEQGLDRAPTAHLGPAATALERRHRSSERGDSNRDVRARNDATRRLRQDFAETADRLAKTAPRVETSVQRLLAETVRVRDDLVRQRTAWERELQGLPAPRTRSVRSLEKALLDDDAGRLARAQMGLKETEGRVARVRGRRLQLVAWIRNPARMIWAKHAELNALSRARAEVRRSETRYALKRAWIASPQGRAAVGARRQTGLDHAADVARERRTLTRKIRRMDKRIGAATQTLDALRVARELGQAQLRVPASSPDATRFLRDVGAPAREVVSRFPAPARQQAIERLNQGRGRSLVRSLLPGR